MDAITHPNPQPIYLPIALTERCIPDRVRADVALVLDASTSMTGEKLDAAKAAALIAAIEAIDVSPGTRIDRGLEAGLEAIYTGIARSIPCSLEAFWGGAETRVAPTWHFDGTWIGTVWQ